MPTPPIADIADTNPAKKILSVTQKTIDGQVITYFQMKNFNVINLKQKTQLPIAWQILAYGHNGI